MSQEKQILIFDTTLRDGEQSPGASLTSDEKLRIAHQLAELGVDILEGGFPAASDDDAAAVARIAREVGGQGGPIITGLARTSRGDIEVLWESVRHAQRSRLHLFVATSDLHLERKLRITRQELLDRIGDTVSFAKSLCPDVEFTTEDGSRADPEFLAETLRVAVQAGAVTLNIADTCGYLMPDEYGGLVKYLMDNVEHGDDVTWSTHTHDDLGLATANTLAGLRVGCRQCEVCINGIGERAGNASLEEVVMALHTRKDLMGLTTNIDTRLLVPTSRLVSELTGMLVPPNKAIVGRNAFAHEAGIHQDGMLKDKRTYEIMRPESVGLTESRLVLGKHSGRAALRQRLEHLGFQLDDEALKAAFRRFKELADCTKEVTDEDLRLIGEEISPLVGA